MRLIKDKIISPAIMLAYELGHAAQSFYYKTAPESIDEYMLREADNLRVYENPIEKELGEYVRKKYEDEIGYYRVGTCTDWGYLTKPKGPVLGRFVKHSPKKPLKSIFSLF